MFPAQVNDEFEVTINETNVTAVHREHKHKFFSPVCPAHLSLGQRPCKKIYRPSEGHKTMSILLMRPPGSNFNGREYLQAGKFDRRRIFVIVAFARRARIFRSRVVTR